MKKNPFILYAMISSIKIPRISKEMTTLGNSAAKLAKIVVDLVIPASSMIYSVPEILSVLIEDVTMTVGAVATTIKTEALPAISVGGTGAYVIRTWVFVCLNSTLNFTSLSVNLLINDCITIEGVVQVVIG